MLSSEFHSGLLSFPLWLWNARKERETKSEGGGDVRVELVVEDNKDEEVKLRF